MSDQQLNPAKTSGKKTETPKIDRVGLSVAADPFANAPRTESNRSGLLSRRVGYGLGIALLICAFLATFWVGWIGGWNADRLFNRKVSELTTDSDFSAVVERIVDAESNGDASAKNRRSSARGLGQFLDETWLEMIAAHRADLFEGRSRMDILELRRDPDLAREMTARLVKRNAKLLSQRSLPVTPGTLYLAHFAGTAGAIAILSVPENERAASIMASADATGRTTPERIVFANPFLADFTVADLKRWADRKMGSAERLLASTAQH